MFTSASVRNTVRNIVRNTVRNTARNATRTSRQSATRGAALGLSALCTLVILGSINLLAMPTTTDAVMARSEAPVQVIVIEGKRLHS